MQENDQNPEFETEQTVETANTPETQIEELSAQLAEAQAAVLYIKAEGY